MSTCAACGSETVADATCVVCGAEPDAIDPTTSAPDAFGTPEDQTPAQPTPSRAPDGPGAVAVATAPPPPPAAPGPGPRPSSPPGPPPPPAIGGDDGSVAAPPSRALVPPQPGAVPVDESARNWGMVTHLSALVSAGLGGLIFLGPLLVWLVKKDDDPFVAHHATEALNFNLSMTLYTVLGVLLVFTVIGIPLTILMALIGFPLWFVASIVAAVRAQRGEGFRYPLTIRLVRE